MSDTLPAIYSTREDEGELRDAINDFVIGLAEDVDALQDAESNGDLPKLAALCEVIAKRAERLGYGPLAEVGREVAAAARDDKPEAARSALEQLTDVGHRIRLGHRGAA